MLIAVQSRTEEGDVAEAKAAADQLGGLGERLARLGAGPSGAENHVEAALGTPGGIVGSEGLNIACSIGAVRLLAKR